MSDRLITELEELTYHLARAEERLEAAVAAEREMCAKVVEDMLHGWHSGDGTVALREALDAIRARGQEPRPGVQS